MDQLHDLNIGGVIALGIDPSSTWLLIVSHSGRGLIDLNTGEKVARDEKPAYPENEKIEGIGPLKGTSISVTVIEVPFKGPIP